MNCPKHTITELRICRGWKPFMGVDPEMKRYVCLDCSEYWYKAPKTKIMRRVALEDSRLAAVAVEANGAPPPSLD